MLVSVGVSSVLDSQWDRLTYASTVSLKRYDEPQVNQIQDRTVELDRVNNSKPAMTTTTLFCILSCLLMDLVLKEFLPILQNYSDEEFSHVFKYRSSNRSPQ